MITICMADECFGEIFFFNQDTVFWLPTVAQQDSASYDVYTHIEKFPSNRWLPVSSEHLTRWDGDA